jgi:hypothetical protein
MKKARLISGLLCGLIFFLMESSIAQTNQEILQSHIANLQEVQQHLNCENPDWMHECVGSEDKSLFIEKRDWLIEQINLLSPFSINTSPFTSGEESGNARLAGGITNHGPDPAEKPSRTAANPLVSETYAQLLANAEASLQNMKDSPDASTDRIEIVEARIANLKSKLNQN